MPGAIQEGCRNLSHGPVLSRHAVIVLIFFGFMSVFPDAISQTAGNGAISSSADCTEITINYRIDGTLTREEAINRMDQAFYESLNQYDACQMSLSTSSNSKSAGNAGGGSGAAGEAAPGDGDAGATAGSAGAGGVSRSVASPNLSGTETSISDSSISATARTQGSIIDNAMDQPFKKGKTGELPIGSGKVPEDIPAADNDSVLEAQIRQAAMNETDPKTREKLWREYRKYKGLPQPADQ